MDMELLEDTDPGMAKLSRYCRQLESSLVHKLTQLAGHRPAIKDQLRGLSTDDQLLQVWDMILKRTYGIHYWTDVKLATSTKLVKSEDERRQIREIQAQIREAQACYYDYLDSIHDAGADRFGDYHYHYRGQQAMTTMARAAATADAGGVGRQGTVSIQFGAFPILVVVDGEKKKNNLGAAGSLSSGKMVFLRANILRGKQQEIMRATRPKKGFILIGSMQVELPA